MHWRVSFTFDIFIRLVEARLSLCPDSCYFYSCIFCSRKANCTSLIEVKIESYCNKCQCNVADGVDIIVGFWRICQIRRNKAFHTGYLIDYLT